MLTLTTITALLAYTSMAKAVVVAPRADTVTVLTTLTTALAAAPQPTKLSTSTFQHQDAKPTKVKAALDGPTTMTMTIVNKAGRAVTTHHYQNPLTPALPTPPAAPAPGTMAPGYSMHYLVPFGYAGTMMVSAGAMLGQESQIEYSFSLQANTTTNKVAINISFVEAFSFPIMCHCSDGGPTTGCDVPLFARGECKLPDSLNAAGHCVNTAGDDGPASDFFMPCKGDKKAFVYAHDTKAMNNGECKTADFRCEILPNGK